MAAITCRATPDRTAASLSRAWPRTSPTCPRPPFTASSVAPCRNGFDADFQVESYLRHQGSTFVERFDANSYLYITRAMDYFDLARDYGGVLANAFKGTRTRFCIVSFTSDWLFPTPESRALVHALNAAAANVSFVEIKTDKGHDAFLLDEPEFFATLSGFLNGAAEHHGGLGRK
jgi:homoserine O-acetyltransferase